MIIFDEIVWCLGRCSLGVFHWAGGATLVQLSLSSVTVQGLEMLLPASPWTWSQLSLIITSCIFLFNNEIVKEITFSQSGGPSNKSFSVRRGRREWRKAGPLTLRKGCRTQFFFFFFFFYSRQQFENFIIFIRKLSFPNLKKKLIGFCNLC